MEHFLKWVNEKTGLKPYETNRLEVLIDYEFTEQQYVVVETRKCKLTGEILGTRNVLYLKDGITAYRIPLELYENGNRENYQEMVMNGDEWDRICNKVNENPPDSEGYSRLIEELLQKGFSE